MAKSINDFDKFSGSVIRGQPIGKGLVCGESTCTQLVLPFLQARVERVDGNTHI